MMKVNHHGCEETRRWLEVKWKSARQLLKEIDETVSINLKMN